MRKGDVKKQAILDTAEKLFYQKGYEQASVQDILTMLHSSKGCFYHHFESKMAVLETLCAQRADKALKAFIQADEPGLSPVQRLNLLIYYASPVRKGEQRFIAVLLPMAAIAEGELLCQRYGESLTAVFRDVLDSILYEGMTDNVFYPTGMAGLAGLVLSLISLFWREVMRLAALHEDKNGSMALDILAVLELYRRAVERLTDAPFGSVDIVRLTEIEPLLTAASGYARS
jgi:AcrR family transcriptional regulator